MWCQVRLIKMWAKSEEMIMLYYIYLCLRCFAICITKEKKKKERTTFILLEMTSQKMSDQSEFVKGNQQKVMRDQ